MLLTITAKRSPALDAPGDLGFLLHKHPGRVQAFGVYGGQAHVFYPEVSKERCTVVLALEVDPVALTRSRGGADDGFGLGQYVNDRPYVASSLLSVAMAKVFRTALNGRCQGHEELAGSALDLTITLPVVPGDRDLMRRLFAPMGWHVDAVPIAFDSTRPDWGMARLVTVTLVGSMRLATALNHLYVLLPVLDDAKHYWVGDAEVDKLIRAGSGWLATHPERELITHRYLAHQRDLKTSALERLDELDDGPGRDSVAGTEPVASQSLVRKRHEAVLAVVRPAVVISDGGAS